MQGDSATFNRILARSLNYREYTFTFRATDHMANAGRWLTTEIHASEAIQHDTTVIRQVALTNDGLHFVNSILHSLSITTRLLSRYLENIIPNQ